MNLPYHLARWEGKMARASYRARLSAIARERLRVERELPFEVFSYSGESSLPEQVASIRSFLANAGRPKQFTVVSDGSHTDASAALLQKIDNCVRVERTAPSLPSGLPDKVHARLTEHFTGRQLSLIMSLPMNGPTLYTDADVVFFPAAKELADLSRTQSVPALYLSDYQFSADERLIREAEEKEKPVNMGFLFLFQKLDWSRGLERLRNLTGTPNFFTTQTVVHLCMHANSARPFDPQKFVLQADDEFIYRDLHAGPTIAMRHYVNPVRHKFWTQVGRRSSK
jgi:hypothetical protein